MHLIRLDQTRLHLIRQHATLWSPLLRCSTWQQDDFNMFFHLNHLGSLIKLFQKRIYVAHTASMDVIATRFDVKLTNVRIDHSSAPGNWLCISSQQGMRLISDHWKFQIHHDHYPALNLWFRFLLLCFSYLPPSDLVSTELTLQVTTQDNQQNHKAWNLFQGAATSYFCSSTIASVSRKPLIHHCLQSNL